MANVLIEEQSLGNIADAIREKLGESDLMLAEEMPDKIRAISGGGDVPYNLFINTYGLTEGEALAPADRPRMFAQPADTVIRGTNCIAMKHGMKSTTSNTSYPYIRIGSTASDAGRSLNGLEVGKTYALDFDASCLVYSATSGSSTRYCNVVIVAYSEPDVYTMNESIRVVTVKPADYGKECSAHAHVEFTIPEGSAWMSITLRPSATTAGYFAAGVDFVAMDNMMLYEVGNAYFPAPEDLVAKSTNGIKKLIQNVSSSEISARAAGDNTVLLFPSIKIVNIPDNARIINFFASIRGEKDGIVTTYLFGDQVRFDRRDAYYYVTGTVTVSDTGVTAVDGIIIVDYIEE